MARVLNQLNPIEGATESGKFEGRDDLAATNEGHDGRDVPEAANHSVSPFDPTSHGGEIMSPLLPEQSPEPIEEVGPSSPRREQILVLPSEPIFQTPPAIMSTPVSKAYFSERFVFRASKQIGRAHV